jgi:chemotaxis protein methyltransferase CheR
VWSAGCSTGPEPYSIAILLDRLLPDRARWDVRVRATDINPAALEEARRGLYRAWSLRDLPAALRDRYFARRGPDRFELDPAIRGMVAFEAGNLTREPPPSTEAGSMDLILCRNALMYLTPEAFQATVARLQRALAKRGWLVVAPVEAYSERFRPLTAVNFPGAIFFRKGRTPRTVPTARPLQQVRTAKPPPPDALPAAAETGKPAGAVATTVAQDRPDVRRLLDHAGSLADRGDLDQALRVCQAALDQDRLDPVVHRLMAAIHQERGDVPAALESLRRALYLDPDSPEVHLALGNVLLQCGERRRALRHLETAARLGLGTERP